MAKNRRNNKKKKKKRLEGKTEKDKLEEECKKNKQDANHFLKQIKNLCTRIDHLEKELLFLKNCSQPYINKINKYSFETRKLKEENDNLKTNNYYLRISYDQQLLSISEKTSITNELMEENAQMKELLVIYETLSQNVHQLIHNTKPLLYSLSSN